MLRHPLCGACPVFIRPVRTRERQLVCDAFCGPFARSTACKLLEAEVNFALKKGARCQDGGWL